MQRILYTLFVLSLCLCKATAENLPAYTTTVSDMQVKIKDGEVVIACTIHTGNEDIKTTHKRILTPVIVSDNGDERCELPAIAIYGRSRAIKELRSTPPISIRITR